MEKLNENITVNKDGDSNVSTAVMMKVSKISVVSNVALTAFKLVAGIVGKSSAMVADAVHSLSEDVAGSALVMFGAKISGEGLRRGPSLRS